MYTIPRRENMGYDESMPFCCSFCFVRAGKVEVKPMVDVPLEEMTDRQLLLHIARYVESQVILMAELDQSVADLQAAVDAVAQRFNDVVGPLNQALADAQVAVAALQVDDAATHQQLLDALNNAQAAANEIEAQVSELNAVGAPAPAPEPAPEPAPTEPPVV